VPHLPPDACLALPCSPIPLAYSAPHNPREVPSFHLLLPSTSPRVWGVFFPWVLVAWGVGLRSASQSVLTVNKVTNRLPHLDVIPSSIPPISSHSAGRKPLNARSPSVRMLNHHGSPHLPTRTPYTLIPCVSQRNAIGLKRGDLVRLPRQLHQNSREAVLAVGRPFVMP